MKLLTNHMDAWGLTLIISTVALVIHNSVTIRNFAFVAALTLCYWFGFAINDYFDRTADAQDQHKAARNFFVTHAVPAPLIILVALALLSAALLILAQSGMRGIVIFITGCAAMWAYSAPPLRFKSRAGFDLLMHILFVETFPYLSMLFLLNVTWLPVDYALLIFFGLGSLAAQLEQQVRDYDVDRAAGETNFTIRVGRPLSAGLLRLTTAALIGVVLLSTITGVIPTRFIPFGVICLPIMLHRFWRDTHQPRSERLSYLTLAAAMIYASIVLANAVLR